MKLKFYLLIAMLLFSIFSIGQKAGQLIEKPYIGEAGIKKKISELQDVTSFSDKALRVEFKKTLRPMKFYMKKFRDATKPSVDEEADDLEGTETDKVNRAAKSTFGMAIPGKSATQEIGSNYQGTNFDDDPLWPPDPNGAVGSSQVIVMANAGFRVFEKQSAADAPLTTPKGYSKKIAPSQFFIGLDKFFSPVLPARSYTSDPHIRYDRLSKRWFIVCIEVNQSFANNFVLMAVSSGERVTDSSSFTYYRFPSALFPYSPAEGGAPFFDYPTLGVDKNAVLIGGNAFMYSGDSVYFVGYAVDKQRLLSTGSLRIFLFRFGVYNSLTNIQTGMGVPQGVHNDDPSVNTSFYVGNDFVTLKDLYLSKITFNNAGNVTGLANTRLPVAPYNAAREVTSPGALQPIDPLDTRLLAASIHKNKLTGKSSLWTAHAVGVNPAGNFVADANFEKRARTSSRWYELGDIYGTPAISQLGNVFDGSEPSGRRATQFFNPSIAANGQGHAVISGTTAAFDEYLNVFVAGRYAGDENSTMNKPVKATRTTALYAPFVPFYGYIGRWGDYSQTVVDPMDDQTIWTFQEYANVDDKYGVRVVQLKAPPPPQTLLPLGAFSNKENTTVTVEGTSDDYSGFFDPGNDAGGPGYNRLSVKSSGGITVSNVKLVSPTQITFTLNTNRKQAGKYTLIITNPDGQLVTADYRINNKEATVTSSADLQSNSVQVDKVAQSFITASRVYPNPAFSNVNIQVTAAKDHEARIIMVDLSGKLMYEKYFNFGKGSNNAVLSLSGLVKGTYFAGVYNSENVLIAKHKIVKE